jgi:hypothetical protein
LQYEIVPGLVSGFRLGPGTAICATRIPPVQAAAVATLNRIAPGRIFLGIGTGNNAKWRPAEDFARLVMARLPPPHWNAIPAQAGMAFVRGRPPS